MPSGAIGPGSWAARASPSSGTRPASRGTSPARASVRRSAALASPRKPCSPATSPAIRKRWPPPSAAGGTSWPGSPDIFPSGSSWPPRGSSARAPSCVVVSSWRAHSAWEGDMRIRTKDLDARAIAYHYDVSNDFYALFLDRRMAYTCAYYRDPDGDLDQAQEDKLDLVCRKLR